MIIGAEKKIVFLNTHKPTAVAQATVNVIGVFSIKKDIAEQKINKIADVTGINENDDIYKILQAVFNAGGQEVVVYGRDLTSGMTTYKEMFDDVRNDWFGTVVDTTDLEEIAKISSEIGAREKMLFAQIASTETIGELETKVKAIGEDTTALFVSKNDETLAGAVAGYSIAQFPGAVLIANKLINGTIDSGLSGAEQSICDSLNLNYMATMKGQLGLANGVTITKDSIDFVHCIKSLKFRLEEDCTLWLKATVKPTFYDLASLKSEILTRCKQFENKGCLAEDKTEVYFPELEEIPKNDILNGVLTGVNITVYYTFGVKELRVDLYFAV